MTTSLWQKPQVVVDSWQTWEAADYIHRLVELARNNLRALPRGGADEEDVALSAFDSFCRGAEQGRFPRLNDRRRRKVRRLSIQVASPWMTKYNHGKPYPDQQQNRTITDPSSRHGKTPQKSKLSGDFG